MSVIETLIEVTLKNDQNFLKIKETLTRIGIAASKEKKLYQSCHILHKQGHYFITHFKELFALDGKVTNFSDDDKKRRNTIVSLLEQWDLVEVIDKEAIKDKAAMNQIKIIPFKTKAEWELISKYSIGRKKV